MPAFKGLTGEPKATCEPLCLVEPVHAAAPGPAARVRTAAACASACMASWIAWRSSAGLLSPGCARPLGGSEAARRAFCDYVPFTFENGKPTLRFEWKQQHMHGKTLDNGTEFMMQPPTHVIIPCGNDGLSSLPVNQGDMCARNGSVVRMGRLERSAHRSRKQNGEISPRMMPVNWHVATRLHPRAPQQC